jgi:hypothetical protein
MENLPNFENNEAALDRRIEELAAREGMPTEDIFSDIITFAELAKEDEDAKYYFEELGEKLGVPFEVILEYANKKAS